MLTLCSLLSRLQSRQPTNERCPRGGIRFQCKQWERLQAPVRSCSATKEGRRRRRRSKTERKKKPCCNSIG